MKWLMLRPSVRPPSPPSHSRAAAGRSLGRAPIWAAYRPVSQSVSFKDYTFYYERTARRRFRCPWDCSVNHETVASNKIKYTWYEHIVSQASGGRGTDAPVDAI